MSWLKGFFFICQQMINYNFSDPFLSAETLSVGRARGRNRYNHAVHQTDQGAAQSADGAGRQGAQDRHGRRVPRPGANGDFGVDRALIVCVAGVRSHPSFRFREELETIECIHFEGQVNILPLPMYKPNNLFKIYALYYFPQGPFGDIRQSTPVGTRLQLEVSARILCTQPHLLRM